jgi:hypothetical protein
MKAPDFKMRLIVYSIVVCFLASVGGRVAQAQVTPKSGAMLTISGTAGGNPVHIVIYDSQIHSGTVQAVPVVGTGTSSCTSTDATYPTDAYVLQGGSWTGCDPGDEFEVTENNTSGFAHQLPGKADISRFHIETHYICSGACSGFVSPPAFSSYCNSSRTICTILGGPDSGFLTVTNNTGFDFTGTITLQGNSPIAGGSFCPASVVEGGPGVASDSWTSGLAAGASVRLALGSEGNTYSPKGADSSNCGGFNAPQTQGITAGATTIFQIGHDDLQITPLNSNPGDTLTLLPVPVPAGPLSGNMFGSEIVGFTTTPFSAGINYPTQASIPYSDLSANKNPVGLELQLSCTPAPESADDCGTFINSTQVDFDVDKNSFPSGIGGAQFLGEHDNSPVGYNGQCPTEGFNVDIFFAYTATTPDPIKGKTLGNSCFVTTFDPTAAAVPAGTTVTTKTFEGFFFPVSDTKLNIVEDGLPVPLDWKSFDNISGKPVTNLTLCPNSTGTGCTAPWVSVATLPINCTTHQPTGTLTPAPGNSLFLNFKNGTYLYFLKTAGGSSGCFTPVLTFSIGLVEAGVANFKFI